jgi:serine phosphatase RsbU (regulator of sigma subunit)
MPFLTVNTPRGGTYRHELVGRVTRIGRLSDNDVVVRDPTVSRHHASVEQRADGDYILDAGGRWGTLVNGMPVDRPTRLRPGDSIQIGETRLWYEFATPPPITLDETPPSPGLTTTSIPIQELQTPVPVASGGPSLLDVLVAADQEVMLQRSPSEVFNRILDLAGRVVPFDRGAVMTLEGDELVPQVVRGAEDGLALSRTIAEGVLRERRALLIRDARAERPFQHSESIVREGVRSAMCVPLWSGERILGLVYVDHLGEAGKFHEQSLALLTHFANLAAIAIETKRLVDRAVKAGVLEKQLRSAAEIQRRLLPEAAPEIPGYDAHGVSQPCFEVGGDCFDYFGMKDGRFGIALGDVAGKRLPAALLMGLVQSGLDLLVEEESDPVRILSRLNRVLYRRIPPNRFVTLFFGVLDPAAHRLTYLNAGQNVPLIVGPEGGVTELPTTGLPLGMFPAATYAPRVAELGPGALLLLYSDGVTDALDAGARPFGFDRLQAAVLEARGREPARVVADVLETVGRHQGEVPNADDLTLLALRRRPA